MNFVFRLDLIAAIMVAVCCFIFSPFTDTHWPEWWTTMLVCLVTATAIVAFMRIRLIFVLLACYVVLNGLMTAFYRDTNSNLHLLKQLDLWHHGASATIAFIALFGVGLFFVKTRLEIAAQVLAAFFFFAVAHAVVVAIQFAIGREFAMTYGLLPNTSMAASMMAMLFPAMVYHAVTVRRLKLTNNASPLREDLNFFVKHNWLLFFGSALVFGTILIHQSSIAWAALIATAIAAATIEKRWIGIGLVAFGVVAIFAGHHIDPEWSRVAETTRANFWPKIIAFPIEQGRWIFGMGLGSFRHWGPELQMLHQFEVGNWWLWAHSDWVQIFFELGIVGLGLSLVCFLRLLWLSFIRRDAISVALLVPLGVVMCGNYPLRLGEFAFLTAVICAFVYKRLYSGSYSDVGRMRRSDS